MLVLHRKKDDVGMLRYFNNAISLHQRLSEPSKLILLTVLVILGVWLYSGFFPIERSWASSLPRREHS
jgi:hypothetical protein